MTETQIPSRNPVRRVLRFLNRPVKFWGVLLALGVSAGGWYSSSEANQQQNRDIAISGCRFRNSGNEATRIRVEAEVVAFANLLRELGVDGPVVDRYLDTMHAVQTPLEETDRACTGGELSREDYLDEGPVPAVFAP